MKGSAALSLILPFVAAQAIPVMAASPYFPAQPSVDDPSDGAVSISTNPELSGSILAEIDATGASGDGNNLTLTRAEWRIFEDASASDTPLRELGGVQGGSAVNLDSIPASTYEYPLPAPVDFGSASATTLEVVTSGTARLKSDSGAVLREVILQPGGLSDIRPVHESAITVQSSPSIVRIQWEFESDLYASDIVLQSYFLTAPSPAIYLFAAPSDLSNAWFNNTNGTIKISLGPEGNPYSLSELKTQISTLDSESTVFALAFTENETGDAINIGLVDPELGTPDTASWTDFIEVTADSVVTPDPQLLLAPATSYGVQVRYVASEGGAERISDWSAPAMFVTELNSEYDIEQPTLEASPQATVPTEVTLEIANVGEHGGKPRAEFRLPFNDSSGASFDITTSVSGQGCEVVSGDDLTVLFCEQALDASAAMEVVATITPAEAGTLDIEYRVCESLLDRCEGVPFETYSVDVAAAPEINNPQPGSGDEENNESTTGGDPDFGAPSSSGSISWLPLLGLALLRRRRYTSHRH